MGDKIRIAAPVIFAALLLLSPWAAVAQGSTSTVQGVLPFSSEPDTYERSSRRLFPLMSEKMREKIKGRERDLPPPFGVMYVTNWMDSDWQFQSAAVSLKGSPYINLEAAQNATMDLQIRTNGAKADLWVFPFLDVMVGVGRVDVDAQLGLRDIPVDYDPGSGTTTYADAIIPMEFEGDYYSIGGVLAGAYKRLYGAADFSWVKTELTGNAELSADGFWTFTFAPKVGYNAGLSQVYVGARYISKNEHFMGTVELSGGEEMGFDVNIKTASWAPNFGVRSVIRKQWEVFMESSLGVRHQITGGIGYRW